MDPKLLTEDGWKAIVQKFKLKDKDLQKTFFFYENLEEDDFDFRLKALGKISTLAAALKKDKEVAGLPVVVKYLTDMGSAAQTEQREVTKAKADAEKEKAAAAKVAALTQKKADEEEKSAKENEGDEEEDEEAGDYRDTLLNAFKRLKSSKELEYNFIVCDAKPQVGLWMSKQLINAKHKAELTKITGGSKRFLKPGKCRVESGKLVFDMEEAPPGLAVKLKKSFKYFTSLNVGVILGDQSDEDEEGQPERAGQKEKPEAAPVMPALAEAPEAWDETRRVISTNIDQLKDTVRKEFAGEGPDMVKDIEKNMKKLDGILDKLDNRLSASLNKARAAKDLATRKTELSHSKTLLADYIKFVKSEPIIAHIDANPFGVKTNLKQTLTESLTKMARAIG